MGGDSCCALKLTGRGLWRARRLSPPRPVICSQGKITPRESSKASPCGVSGCHQHDLLNPESLNTSSRDSAAPPGPPDPPATSTHPSPGEGRRCRYATGGGGRRTPSFRHCSTDSEHSLVVMKVVAVLDSSSSSVLALSSSQPPPPLPPSGPHARPPHTPLPDPGRPVPGVCPGRVSPLPAHNITGVCWVHRHDHQITTKLPNPGRHNHNHCTPHSAPSKARPVTTHLTPFFFPR